jgi:hypothetical protein
MLLLAQQSYSQQPVHEILEDFDRKVSFSQRPQGSWRTNTVYSLPSPKPTGVSKSYQGIVPSKRGDSTFLQSAQYDFTNSAYVRFRFSHICKISPKDQALIQYRRAGESKWYTIDAQWYNGKAKNYTSIKGFNAASYPEWLAKDSTALPSQSWWKDEIFDMSADWNNAIVEIRFVIVHGDVLYTDVSYGWLLENVQITAASHQLHLPVVELLEPFIADTVYNTGKWTVNAKVATRTKARIAQPQLVYTATKNGQLVKTNTVLMSNAGGDSLWTGSIEQFEAGTKVVYSVIGKDTTGNETTVSSSYYIKRPPGDGKTNYVIVGTGDIVNNITPISFNFNYSWSCQLYLGSEITVGSVGGTITRLAWDYAYTMPWTDTNQVCYFKVVDNTFISPNSYNPLADDATQVWKGTIETIGSGWVEIILDKPFLLPPGKNLLVYWHHKQGNTVGYSFQWRHTKTPKTMTAYSYSDNCFSDTTKLWCAAQSRYYTLDRPNARFYIEETPIVNHAATTLSIDINDTVAVAPNYQIPVVATIKNNGNTDLQSVTVSYSVNGSTPKDTVVHFSPALQWDFDTQITLGTYAQRSNEYDTVTVWVSYPNGQHDSIAWDDTLTKRIYGTSDLQLTLIKYPADTAAVTGPFPVWVNIRSLTGKTDIASSTYLSVETVSNKATQYDTLHLSLNAATGLWETSIPQTPFYSKVKYRLVATDFLGNVTILADSFYTVYERSGYVIVGTGKVTNETTPVNMYYNYSWTRQLYLATELTQNGNERGTITKLAWSYAHTDTFTSIKQACYFKVVDDTYLTSDTYIDPLADGATLVWEGTIKESGDTWIEITLDTPFALPAGKNLLVYWDNKRGRFHTMRHVWNHTTTQNVMTAYGYADQCFSGTSTLGCATDKKAYSLDRPNARFYIVKDDPYANSVALVSIDSPQKGTVSANVPIPVKVTVRNEGHSDLSSCKIEWAKNDVLQTSFFPGSVYTFAKPLPARFADTLTIGYYTSASGQADDITVWVSLPNNATDSTTFDDTLKVRTAACGNALSGTYTVGASGNASFKSISTAIFMMEKCGVSNKVTLLVEDGHYAENIDLSILKDVITKTDTVEIMSASGKAADVVFKAKNFGVTMQDINNIYIKNISLHISGTGFGVLLKGNCANIEIAGCDIYIDTTVIGRETNHAGIYKGGNGVADNIRILNNHITGGYTGILLSAIITNKNTRCICNNNIVENAYQTGISIQYTEMPSVTHNTVTPSVGNYMNPSEWWGISLKYCRLDTVASNRIHSLGAKVAAIHRGLSISESNREASNMPVHLVNNEVMVKSDYAASTVSSNYSFGVQLHNSKVNMYHNSVYLRATTWGRVLNNESSTYPVDVKNNMFVGSGIPAWAVFNDASATTADYNNYAFDSVMGICNNRVIVDLVSWKNISGQDTHAISVVPQFADISSSMELSSGFDRFLCTQLPAVSNDINNKERLALTMMGAYTLNPINYGFTYFQFDQWNKEVIVNQRIPVVVKLINLSNVPVDSLGFEWTLNGVSRKHTRLFSTPLASFADTVITIDSFPVVAVNEVEVWLRTINGSATHPMKDSIYARSEMKPLAEFVTRAQDTIYSLTFDIEALIRTYTGAPVTAPQLVVTTIVNNGEYTQSSSVNMTWGNGIWRATVPQQYFGSKIIYSLTVADNIGNTYTITDSTFVKYGYGKKEYPVIGTGTTDTHTNPYNATYGCSWSRNYYLDYEIEPRRKGGFINSISFYNTSTSKALVNNLSFYLKAVTDSVVSNGYVDPLVDGATLVWGSASCNTNGVVGWITFTLNTPFYLPPNMNLLVYCNNLNSKSEYNSPVWRYTGTQNNMSIHAYSMSFPTASSGSKTSARPNIKIDLNTLSDPYLGNNLAILSMVEPINTGDLCTPDFSPVKIAVTNLGQNHYRFDKDSVEVGIEINNPTGQRYHYTHMINKGELLSEATDTIEFMSAMPIMYSGVYTIKAWVNSAIDPVSFDDTLWTQFVSGRVALPIKEDFSNGIPLQFDSRAERGTTKWETYSDSLANIQPDSGAAMIRFAGTPGEVAVLSTKQLDLYQAFNPFVEFWYYHDSNAAYDDISYTDVIVNINGVEEKLATVYLRSPAGLHGWTRYNYPLNQFTATGGCLLIQFKAVSKNSSKLSSQYIDYILVASTPDAAVTEIIITPELTTCDRSGKTVAVVIAATRTQGFTFDKHALILDINGKQHTASLQGKTLAGNSSDTIPVASNVDFPVGKATTMKAFFSVPVDNFSANDTAKKIINLNPKIGITLDNVSSNKNPAMAELEIQQKVTVKNKGNLSLSDIVFVLNVDADKADPPYHFRAEKSWTQPLAPGDSANILFDDSYIVPWSNNYTVKVNAYLKCDSVAVNAFASVQEYVNMTDLYIVAITHPQTGTADVVGSAVNVAVRVKNKNIRDVYNTGDANIGIFIKDEKGSLLSTVALEELPEIGSAEEISYTFKSEYTVPSREKYFLTVYLNSVDKYAANDTMTIERHTNVGTVNAEQFVFSMQQNVPNPTAGSTYIDYSVPQDGEIMFQIYSVSGQLLYMMKENVSFGNHQIALNLSDYASGIYFCSMEYNGQRLVKRINVKH